MELRKIILILFAFSGMAALVYEIVWAKLFQFILGSTVYTTSIVFAAFMAGLALGSFIASKYVDKIKNLLKIYALIELSIGLYGALFLMVFSLLPSLYKLIFNLYESFYFFESIQFLLIFIMLLIPTTLMGATFPLIAKFYVKEKIGAGIGEIYFANNLGAIVGSFIAGFLLMPLLGIKLSLIFAAIFNIGIAFVILSISNCITKKRVLFSFVLFTLFIFIGNYDPQKFYAGGFNRVNIPEELTLSSKFLYHKEGLHTTVSVIKESTGALVLLFNGRGQGSSIITDLRVNFLLSYLPLLLKEDAKNALVIGLGTGTTSGHLANFIKTTTVEIEPIVADASDHFKFMNLDVLKNPSHKLVIADGRNYLLKDKEKYDFIVPEPSDPWQSFSTNLYSKEFFELAKTHLNKGGLYVQWVPIFELDSDTFKSFYKSFNSVFPYTAAFASIKEDEDMPVKYTTPEIILIGSNQPIDVNIERIRKNFDSLPLDIKVYLNAIKLDSPEKIVHLFLFNEKQMRGYGDATQLITDDNLRLEFLSAKKVLYQNPEEVISDIKNFLVRNIK